MEIHKRNSETSNGAVKHAKDVYDKVKLSSIPRFTDLKRQVDEVVAASSWWDMYGVDWAILLTFAASFPISLRMLASDSWPVFCGGVFLSGWMYQAWGTKGGHQAAHGGLTRSKFWHRPLANIFVEFVGSFSEELAYEAHIKEHHPYTNIIGIGDSSTWKVPFLPRYIYMFVAPLLLPPTVVLISIAGLLQKGKFLGIIKYCIVAGAGLALYTNLLMTYSGLSLGTAIAVLWVSRGIFFIPYIHVNIFQHIGLPMYSLADKPVRFYQMTTGVLNLPRNPILDYAFGHAIVSCHVEHHLFPKLSDNMCLKIQPVVAKFIKESSLPYNEKSYMDRVSYFLNKYEKLMINAPPITHFVGIQ